MINIREIQFIDGRELEDLKKTAYSNSRGLPTVAYGEILNTFETELSNFNPTNLIAQQIKRYLTKDNIYLVEISDSYKFRPDMISYIFYGSVEYFQILLLMNEMKSIIEFIPSKKNNLMFVFKEDIIDKVLDF